MSQSLSFRVSTAFTPESQHTPAPMTNSKNLRKIS